GAHALLHGYTRDHVAKLRVVLDNGDCVVAGKESRNADGQGERFQAICRQVTALIESQSDVIAACQPLTRFNRCGYLLHDVLSAEHLDLPRLLVGSEGTLGIFTEATLRTIPLPVSRSIVLLGFAI